MPVFDWLRSELEHRQPDGANALAYDDAAVRRMDPLKSELSLPGWDESYTKEELGELIRQYRGVTEEDLWRSLERFLRAVIPAAEESGIRMAVHRTIRPGGCLGFRGSSPAKPISTACCILWTARPTA